MASSDVTATPKLRSRKHGAAVPLSDLDRRLLNLMRIDDVAVRGFAVGLTAHAIGTAQALQVSEIAGAFAALFLAAARLAVSR